MAQRSNNTARIKVSNANKDIRNVQTPHMVSGVEAFSADLQDSTRLVSNQSMNYYRLSAGPNRPDANATSSLAYVMSTEIKKDASIPSKNN